LSRGVLPKKVASVSGTNEIAEMTRSVNELIVGLRKTTDFAMTIGKSVFDTEFAPLSNEDVLGNSLLEMRQNLNQAQKEEEKRKYEDSLRKWSNEGLAKFNEILRQSTENIEQLSNIVIRELIHFMDANQGGLFILNDTNKNDIHFELVASYAYGHEKKKQKKIYSGEGLVGTAALEKETIYMTDIPSSYITITSGLGGANPRSLLIVPMRVESEIFGVIEIASFNVFQKHEIEFVEKVSESIAASLSITRINARTAQLLEQSQIQAEEKAAQEEEMRQNLEELRQAQEESARREAEMASILNAVDTSSLVIELDTKGFITSVNQAFLGLLSLHFSEIIDKHHRDFVKPSDEKEYNQLWKDLKSGLNVKRTEHIQLREQDFWLSVVYAPIVDDAGRVLKILSIGTDLTESKLLETELLEQAKYMAEQEEEMRQNLNELQATQQEMSEKQTLLQEAGQKSAENEKILQKIVEQLKTKEEELTRKNEQLSLREDELKQNIQKIETAQAKYIEEHQKLAELNQKLRENEDGLKDTLKKSQEQEQLINQRNQQLLAGEEELRQNIEELQSTREQLQEQHEQLIQINEDLAEKEAEIRDRFTALDKNNCIAEYLPDGTLIYANEKFLETFQYRFEEIKDKHHRMFTEDSEKRNEKYTLFWNNLREGISPDGEYRRLKKDGTFAYFRGVYKPLRHAEGDVYKILEILTDITLQKQTEADLVSRIQIINLTNATLEMSLDGTILNVNQMFYTLLGFSESELIGKPLQAISTREYADSESFEKFRIDMRRGLSRHGLFTFVSSSGSEIHLQGTFAPILNADGHVQKTFFLGFDVTEKFA
jgi:PAS domain S-box-containing protein